jgi:hypothetical protein
MKKIVFLCFLVVLTFSVSTVSAKTWFVPKDFTDIQAAIDSPSVKDEDKIMVGPGAFFGATVTKAVRLQARGDTIINNGPKPWPETRPFFVAGFFFQGNGVGSGTSIHGFRFQGVEFPIFSRGANDVTVKDCIMLNAIQAITNWHGQGWRITDNRIKDLQTSNGGGIGVLIGGRDKSWQGSIVRNFIADNKITGVLHVMPGEKGGYNGTGIVLYADFRWGAEGPDEIAYNTVTKNIISMYSDNADLVDIAAVELTDTRDDPSLAIIFDNFIGFNDLRGTDLQIDLTPDNLDQFNWIMNNSGKWRWGHQGFGHQHPKFH